MMDQPHLPGFRWLSAIRNEALRIGISLGICLSAGFIAWLVIANRVPTLERFAWERNAVAAVAMGILAAIPAVHYMRQPSRLFLSGVVAWFIFSIVYRLTFIVFPTLELRLTAPHLFMLGSVIYGLLAVLAWLVQCILNVRDGHASPATGAPRAR